MIRAITIDNELLAYEAATCDVFKEMHRQEVYEDDDLAVIVLIHPDTFGEVPDHAYLDPSVTYLLVVITDTILHEAVRKNCVPLCTFLVDYGYADVNGLDDDDRTALSYCVDPDLCTMLIQAGADVNHVDIEENSAMHHLLTELVGEMASFANFDRIHSIVRTLHVLSWNGADPDLENSEDVSCRELYHRVFPETTVNDEDPDLREFFASASASSFAASTFSGFSSSSASASSSSASAWSCDHDFEMSE